MITGADCTQCKMVIAAGTVCAWRCSRHADLAELAMAQITAPLSATTRDGSSAVLGVLGVLGEDTLPARTVNVAEPTSS